MVSVSRGEDGRVRAHGGGRFESIASYCRAVRVGQRIMVSGTSAMDGDTVVAPCDAVAQARWILDTISTSLIALDSGLDDTVRYRVYVTADADIKGVAGVLGDYFRRAIPASTLVVVAGLATPGLCVEIEVEAMCGPEVSNRAL